MGAPGVCINFVGDEVINSNNSKCKFPVRGFVLTLTNTSLWL